MCTCASYVSIYVIVYEYRWVGKHRERARTINMELLTMVTLNQYGRGMKGCSLFPLITSVWFEF